MAGLDAGEAAKAARALGQIRLVFTHSAGWLSASRADVAPGTSSGAINGLVCASLLVLAATVLCNRPTVEVCEELRERGGPIVGVQSAGVRKNPSMAAAEELLLEADPGVFYTRDDAVGVNANKGDDGRMPAPDFRQEASAAGAKLVVGEFIGAGSGAIDNIGDAEPEVEKK